MLHSRMNEFAKVENKILWTVACNVMKYSLLCTPIFKTVL